MKFQADSDNAMIGGGNYVTSSPALDRSDVHDFLHGHEQRRSPRSTAPLLRTIATTTTSEPVERLARPLPGVVDRQGEALKAGAQPAVPGARTRRCRPGPARQQEVRAYTLEDQQQASHHAYVACGSRHGLGGYYDVEGTDWLNLPLFAHARSAEDRRALTTCSSTTARTSTYIGWREGRVLYWVSNTLLEDLTNRRCSRSPSRRSRCAESRVAALGSRRRHAAPGDRARPSPPSRGAVERGVDERVGVRVLGARDRADRPALEPRSAAIASRWSGRIAGVLDLVEALTCLAISSESFDHLDLGGPQLARPREAEQQGAVLGDVVRVPSRAARRLAEHLAVGRG